MRLRWHFETTLHTSRDRPTSSAVTFFPVWWTNSEAFMWNREAGVTVRFFADDLKMYARIKNYVDITVIRNNLDRLG